MGYTELTPVERVEYYHAKVEDHLLDFDKEMKEDNHIFYEDPVFRRQYFDCIIPAFAMLKYELCKRNRNEERIADLEEHLEKIKQKLLNDLYIKPPMRAELFDMASFFGDKIVKLFVDNLDYFKDRGAEFSDSKSPIYVVYLKVNDVDHPSNYREAACTLIHNWMS